MTLADIIAEIICSLLRPYQQRWWYYATRSRLIAHLGCRQIGKDVFYAALAVFDCLLRRHQWNLFSGSMDQAVLWMKDIRAWHREIVRHAWDAYRVRLPGVAPQGDDSKTALELDNGSLILCHPSTVRRAAGLRGSAAFNEVGQVPHAGEMYGAAFPIAEGQFDQGVDARFILVSNATHEGHWWEQWWTNSDPKHCGSSEGFTKITTTYPAFLENMGVPEAEREKRIESKRRALGDSAFAQWYLCQWVSAIGQYIDNDLIVKQTWSWDQLQRANIVAHTLGYDPGRKSDPFAITPLALAEGGDRFALMGRAQHDTPHHEQRLQLQATAMDYDPVLATAVDTTGPQCQVIEELENDTDVTHCGELVSYPMGYDSRWRMFRSVKEGAETGRLWFHPGDTETKMQVSSIRLGRTPTGLPRLEWARKKNAKGEVQHGDLAVSLALAHIVAARPEVANWI